MMMVVEPALRRGRGWPEIDYKAAVRDLAEKLRLAEAQGTMLSVDPELCRKLIARVDELQRQFSHYYIAPAHGVGCDRCGLDREDEIHIRREP